MTTDTEKSFKAKLRVIAQENDEILQIFGKISCLSDF
jgi:hypothetical protein